jgi:hypothetical protein
MYPLGHARADATQLPALLVHKFHLLAGPAVDDVGALAARFTNLAEKLPEQIAQLYDFTIRGIAD